ncbi:hypothetical protein ACHAQJ_005820 [Trichoderma viride]
MATVRIKQTGDEKEGVNQSTISLDQIPPLGADKLEKRFWWQRTKALDPYAIATQPSVFDDPDTAEKYQPPSNWENIHRFDPLARWTWAEEDALVRKMDLRITAWACVMFMALEMDRTNLSQANSDNFLEDLNLTTNDYNLGNTVFLLSFLLAEIPSQLVSKWIGPDRWIPSQMVLWSIVAGAQFWLSGRSSFLACRALLGLLQGGFIPDIVLYLSYFYKHHELTFRLSWFWGMMTVAEVLAALLAYGILHMRDVDGREGWRWLFLIEGLMTLVVGLLAYGLMPAGPCQTRNWFRGKTGWFSEREEIIIVNRVLREDPSKSSMHNREAITPRLLLKSLSDYDLCYLSEIQNEMILTAMLGQVWCIPFLIWLEVSYNAESNKWVVFTIISLLLSYPYAHPIQVGLNSRNSNTVRSRTVSAATYNMFVQIGNIASSNIYRADDAPLYRRGNKVLLAITAISIAWYVFTKFYYIWRNKQRDLKWDAMTQEEKLHYLATTTDEGNKRLDFRFQH